MVDPIIDDHGLAQLLKIPDRTLTALLERTDLPRFMLDGRPRFLTASVLAWLSAFEGGHELLPPQVEPVAAPTPVATPKPPPAETPRFSASQAGEVAWLHEDALEALASGAGDSGRNLDRLKLRDALLGLNDQLLPILSRLSSGRLHPHHDEKLRTSPWRLEVGTDTRIAAIRIAWGAGEHAPPEFADRPHLEVELARSTLTIRLDAHGRPYAPPIDAELLTALEAEGFELTPHARPASGAAVGSVTKVYGLATPSPTIDAVTSVLEKDLARLVPLWTRLV